MTPSRERICTGHPSVPAYVFTDQEASTVFNGWVSRYFALRKKAEDLFEGDTDLLSHEEKVRHFQERQPLTAEETREMRDLRKRITDYKKRQREEYQSVLAASRTE